MNFSIVYHQGSFVFSDACDNCEDALASALSLMTRPGVWYVHVADADGRPVVTHPEIAAHRRAAVGAVPPRASSNGTRAASVGYSGC
jgi:hypothetical protein